MLDDITITSIERIVLIVIPLLSLIVDVASYRRSMKSHDEYSETMKAYNEQIQFVNNGKQCAISNNATYGNNSPITVLQDQNSTLYLAKKSIQSERDTYAEAVSHQHYQRMLGCYVIVVGCFALSVILGFLFLLSKIPLPLADKIISFRDTYAALMTVIYQALAIANIGLCIGLIVKYKKINDKPCRIISLGISGVAIVTSLYTIGTIQTMNAVDMVGTGLAVSVITSVLLSFLVSNVHLLIKPSTKYKWNIWMVVLCVILRLLPYGVVWIFQNQ